MPEMPTVDLTKCDLCELCVTVCSCHAIMITAKRITFIDTDECGWCTMCEAVCPHAAISCAFEIVIEDR